MKPPTRQLAALPAYLYVVICLLPCSMSAAEASIGFTKSLFDGQSLAGWHVTECETVVDDGAILLKAGDGLVRTDHRYADFVLELEWKAVGKADSWDSGIYFRCELPVGKRHWPSRYQINLKTHQEGNLIGFKGATNRGLAKVKQWNRFRLTVIGKTAALEINGKPAWKVDGIQQRSGYIGLQSEVPLGGQFKFRNIKITELGYKSLFNGKDLTGWEGARAKAETCWTVSDGAIVCSGKSGTWLRSKQQHGDFNLRLDYKVSAGGNSGVFVRVPADGDHHGKDAGVEVQVLDDRHPKYARLKPYQYCGSVYAVAAAKKHVGRPAGEWNSLEINCKGHDYRVTHNGVVIVDAKVGEFPQLKERLTKGFLGLQNHNTQVWYRNLRIGPAFP